MENVVHKGTLHCLVMGMLQKKVWQPRFYVLYGCTRTNQPRLDFYESEAVFEKDPNYRKSIFLEDIRDIQPRSETIKERTHLIELTMSVNKKDVILSCDDAHDAATWLRYLREVRHGQHRLSVPQSRDSHAEHTMFDDNDLYETTEPDLTSFFDVEAAPTESAKKCKLEGRYVLVVNYQSLDLRSDSGETLYSWYYKHIRRYGRSSSSFTFEAGRKSKSGAGLFTFLTDQGDTVFLTVQKQTRSLRGGKKADDTASVGSIEDETPPTLPRRNYAGSGGSIDALEDYSKAGKGKGSPQSGKHKHTKGPPMLRPKASAPGSGSPPRVEYAQVNKHRGVRPNPPAVQYDLAKMFPRMPVPADVTDDEDHLYTEPYEPSRSSPDEDEHEYAIYDITQSTRYAGKPETENEYEVPEDVKLPTRSDNVSDICANLRKTGLATGGNAKPRHKLRGHDYSDIEDKKSKSKRPKAKLPAEENIYDEVCSSIEN